MRIKQTLTALAVTVAVGCVGLASAAGSASAAGTGGTGGPYPEGSQGPCSPGGIWHPDPGWPGTAGWCEYPKKKCWWSCPKPKPSSNQVQPAQTIRSVRPVTAASIYGEPGLGEMSAPSLSRAGITPQRAATSAAAELRATP